LVARGIAVSRPLGPGHVRPVLHLSIPVRDFDEAVKFHGTRLGAEIGRSTDHVGDAPVSGAQVTLHSDPGTVTSPMPRTRHLGATLQRDGWESVAARSDVAVAE